jgi:hypothetical protein
MANMTPYEAYYKCYNEQKRIPELESIIATDYKYSYWHAQDVINGRFEEGERSIATNPQYSYRYARYIIKEIFPLCHHIIFNSEWKDEYIGFLKSLNYDLSEIGEWLI